MKERTKEIIIKLNIVLGGVFGILWILFPLAVGLILGEEGSPSESEKPMPEPYYTIWVTLVILFFAFGAALMILLPVLGLKQKPVKAERRTISFIDYDSLVSHIQVSAKNNGYIEQPVRSFAEGCFLTAFFRREGLSRLNGIVLVRVTELKDERFDMINDVMTESVQMYLGKENIDEFVNMITVFCVDRMTPDSQKLVNGNIEQGFKNGRLPVVISFGSKTVYIAKQKDGIAIAKYKKLRKEFLRIVEDDTKSEKV